MLFLLLALILFGSSIFVLNFVGRNMRKDQSQIFDWRILSIILFICFFHLSIMTLFPTLDWMVQGPFLSVFGLWIFIVLSVLIKFLVLDFKQLKNKTSFEKKIRGLYIFLFTYGLFNTFLFVCVIFFPVKYSSESLSIEYCSYLSLHDYGTFHKRRDERMGFLSDEEFGFYYETNSSIMFINVFPYPFYQVGYKKPINSCSSEFERSVDSFYYKFDLHSPQNFCYTLKGKVKP